MSTRSLLPFLGIIGLMAACTGAKDYDLDTGIGEATPVDNDGDGFSADEDCDDGNASINPVATEVCDGLDNNCDGEIDEDVTAVYYPDLDGDGWGDPTAPEEACAPSENYVSNDGDCDDTNASINPGSTVVDSDECETGVDHNCDGVVDQVVGYYDGDEDGYGADSTAVTACELPSGHVTIGGDCDDEDPSRNPSADEVCDGIDNDCDGDEDQDDDDVIATTWYADEDGDGHGNVDFPTEQCEQPSGYVSNYDDCDDNDAMVGPDTVWFIDGDVDGEGDPDPTMVVEQCEDPSGSGVFYATNPLDCNDDDASVNSLSPDASFVDNSGPAGIPDGESDCYGGVNFAWGTTDGYTVFEGDSTSFTVFDAYYSIWSNCNSQDNWQIDGGGYIVGGGLDKGCGGIGIELGYIPMDWEVSIGMTVDDPTSAVGIAIGDPDVGVNFLSWLWYSGNSDASYAQLGLSECNAGSCTNMDHTYDTSLQGSSDMLLTWSAGAMDLESNGVSISGTPSATVMPGWVYMVGFDNETSSVAFNNFEFASDYWHLHGNTWSLTTR